MSKSPLTAELVNACLESRPFAWQALVDQCAPAVLEAIQSLGKSTGRKWKDEDVASFSAKVFESLRADNYGLLRTFDATMNADTFLTVVVRRAVATAEPASS